MAAGVASGQRSEMALGIGAICRGSLFGASLDPILIEDKNKKVLPIPAKKAEQKSAPYFRKQSYHQSDQDIQQSRYFSRSGRQPDRHYSRDRPRFQPQGKRPFRGGGGCPYHWER